MDSVWSTEELRRRRNFPRTLAVLTRRGIGSVRVVMGRWNKGLSIVFEQHLFATEVGTRNGDYVTL